MKESYNPLSINFYDVELRNLIEEYITHQKTEFTLKSACSYVLYWLVEDGKIAEAEGMIESNELQSSDQDRVRHTLSAIVEDGKNAFAADDDTKYEIIKS